MRRRYDPPRAVAFPDPQRDPPKGVHGRACQRYAEHVAECRDGCGLFGPWYEPALGFALISESEYDDAETAGTIASDPDSGMSDTEQAAALRLWRRTYRERVNGRLVFYRATWPLKSRLCAMGAALLVEWDRALSRAADTRLADESVSEGQEAA